MVEERKHKDVSTEDIVKMDDFVLENNYFEFNGNVQKQISSTAIGTSFALLYTCVFMDELETKFLQSQTLQPLVLFIVFFILTYGKEKLKKYLENLNSFDNNIKLNHESSNDNVTFLDFITTLSKDRLNIDLHIKDTD